MGFQTATLSRIPPDHKKKVIIGESLSAYLQADFILREKHFDVK